MEKTQVIKAIISFQNPNKKMTKSIDLYLA